MDLNGRVALVTGSAQGIGRAIATLFGRGGATVVISDIDGGKAERTAAELREAGHAADVLHLDVGDAASVGAAFGSIASRHGRLDILVNNAGIGRIAPFVDFTLADFELCLKVNLTGAFLCGQAAARQMLWQRETGSGPRGKIINVVSTSGQRGGFGRAGYGSAKAGLELLTRVMATELAGRGINVNAIAPGPIRSEMSDAGHAAAARDAYLFLTPQGRYGEPEEVARAALFLASDASDFVNGQTLNVDGGFGAAGLMYPLPAGGETGRQPAEERP